MICLRLFWEYFKIGLFAVGGGMGTVPFLYDLADKTGWFTHVCGLYCGRCSRYHRGGAGIGPARCSADRADCPGTSAVPAQPVCGGCVPGLAAGVHGPDRGRRHHSGHDRADGQGVVPDHGESGGPLPVEGVDSGGSGAGIDQLGKAHKEVAPRCVHRHFGGGGRCIPLCGGVRRAARRRSCARYQKEALCGIFRSAKRLSNGCYSASMWFWMRCMIISRATRLWPPSSTTMSAYFREGSTYCSCMGFTVVRY